jgi:hypothetical protein
MARCEAARVMSPCSLSAMIEVWMRERSSSMT